MIDNFFWEYFTKQRKKMLHSCQRDTWYEGSLNGILGVKWTHEGPLMDIWTDTSGRVSNAVADYIQAMLQQEMFLSLLAATIVQLGH